MIDEQALLIGIRRLDPQALADTHDAYYPAIFRYIAYKVGHQETAEDLTGDVFLRLLEAVQARNAPQKTLRGWLYAVASNVVNEYYRRQYRGKKETAIPDSFAGDAPGPDEQIIKKQTLETVHQALGQLTADQRAVIELRYGYELSINETAQMLNKSEGAVKQLQARAVASLGRVIAVNAQTAANPAGAAPHQEPAPLFSFQLNQFTQIA